MRAIGIGALALLLWCLVSFGVGVLIGKCIRVGEGGRQDPAHARRGRARESVTAPPRVLVPRSPRHVNIPLRSGARGLLATGGLVASTLTLTVSAAAAVQSLPAVPTPPALDRVIEAIAPFAVVPHPETDAEVSAASAPETGETSARDTAGSGDAVVPGLPVTSPAEQTSLETSALAPPPVAPTAPLSIASLTQPALPSILEPSEPSEPSPAVSPSDSPEAPVETPTETPTESPTGTPTQTPTESPTGTPTDSPAPSPTDSAGTPPTDPSASPSPSDTPSDSPTPTPTSTPSESPSATDTPEPSSTDVPSEGPSTPGTGVGSPSETQSHGSPTPSEAGSTSDGGTPSSTESP